MSDSGHFDSTIPPSHPTGVDEALSHVRFYTDDAAVDRVWTRLDSRRRIIPVLAPVSRASLVVALVAAGALLGVFYERQRMQQHEVAAVSSEVITAPEVVAAPSDDVARARAPRAEPDEKEEQARRRVRRLSAPVTPGPSDPSDGKLPVDEAPVVEADAPVAPVEKPEWLLLAERGEFASSFQKLDESGGFDAVVESGSSEELMMLVEVARFVGRPGRAIQALRAVTERHQTDPNAPIAAMILGNLLSRSGDTAGAAQAYALNRRLSPGGDFAEDALVGEFDMALAAGDLARVERLRAQYVAEFPEGRHLENILAEARRLRERTPPSGIEPTFNAVAKGDVSEVPARELEDDTEATTSDEAHGSAAAGARKESPPSSKRSEQ